jgi:hypothetical protein
MNARQIAWAIGVLLFIGAPVLVLFTGLWQCFMSNPVPLAGGLMVVLVALLAWVNTWE